MKRIIVLVLVLMLTLLSNAFANSNANVNSSANVNANSNINVVNVIVKNTVPIEQTGKVGRVNWGQGAQGTVEALGTGFPPANIQNPAQAKALARRAAIVDAYRNLTETINGVRVDSKTTVHNLALDNDVITTRVSGIVQGARVVRELPQTDGSYQIVMAVNLFGPDSVAEVAMTATKPQKTQEFPQPAAIQPSRPDLNYTGVIIDARGFGLEPTFSPLVYDASGRIIYGNMYIDADFAISQGMVEYAITSDMLESAIKGGSRAGNKPMLIKAIAVKDNNCNVVISDTDANMVLASNASAGFLKNCAVVFAK